MGLKYSKPKDPLLPVEETHMTQEECNMLESIYEKQDAEGLEQFRVIEKYLIEDENEYKNYIDAYREKQGSYVIYDRTLIRRGEELMLRRAIQWDNCINLKWKNV
jgi:predicted glutamine amidotransferase